MEQHIKKYHPLGPKTLFMFIFIRSSILVLMVPLFIVGVFLLDYVPLEYEEIAIKIFSVYSIVLIFAVVFVFFFGWLQYFRYWIFIDDRDLKISRGLIAIEQIGIPFRRIQDIKIKRSLIDQIFGISDVVITVFGEEDDATTPHDESVVILPSVSKEIGLEIQDILLKKAQVEQIHVLGGQRVT